MEPYFYHKLFNEASSGYAILKKTAAHDGVPEDYELVSCNLAFKNMVGLSEPAGHRLGELSAESSTFEGMRGLIAEAEAAGQRREAENYCEAARRWFRMETYLLEPGFYAIQCTDISAYKSRLGEADKEIGILRNEINGARVGLWEWNVQTGEQIINERWAAILGYTLEELEPISIKTWRKLVHPDDLIVADRELQEVFWKDRKHYTLTFRMKHKHGRWVWIESSAIVNSWQAEGQPLIVSGSHIDITKRKLAEDALKENERRLISSQEIARVGNWELDLGTKEMWASKEAFNIYGIEQKTNYLPLVEAQAQVLPEYRKMMDDALADLIVREEKYDVEFKIINRFTHKELSVHSKAILEKDKAGRPIKVIGTIQDKTEDAKRRNELLYLSYHDQLTGLYNRRFFNEELVRLDSAGNLPMTVVLCDVNGLKLINDSFGHDLGDELLRRVAKIICLGCRTGDVVSRYGGDEFALILPTTDESQAETVIKRIKGLISGEKVGAFDVSVSFGYETKHREAEDISTISKNAEDHMYSHKLYESRSARSKTVDLIISTLYEKNHREMLHSRRVSALCEAFASYIGASKDEVNKIKIAGLMHDIGKIGIDEKILNKQGKLSSLEWEEVKRHSEIGYRILGSVNEFLEIAEFVLEHQERWDGTGYPKGLKGEMISFAARIISISDAYDAMTGIRTYGRALSGEEALEEIRRCAGSQFDPNLVKIFLEMQAKSADRAVRKDGE